MVILLGDRAEVGTFMYNDHSCRTVLTNSYVRLHSSPYWKTSSSGMLNTRAIRNATASDREYLFPAIAFNLARGTDPVGKLLLRHLALVEPACPESGRDVTGALAHHSRSPPVQIEL